MFTGIIHTSGVIEAIDRLESGARIRLRTTAEELFERGESVAVSGVCLTVVDKGPSSFSFQIGPETLALTNLGELFVKMPVNLERSLRLSDRLGGHIVQGHVDGMGRVEKRERQEQYGANRAGGENEPWPGNFGFFRFASQSCAHISVQTRGSAVCGSVAC